MKMKKVISIGMLLAMTVSLAAGCGANGDGASAKGDAEKVAIAMSQILFRFPKKEAGVIIASLIES